MNRFWSFQTKFVVVLALLMLGALLLQSYVHERNNERLKTEVEKLAERIANQVTAELAVGISGRTLSLPDARANVWDLNRGNDSKAMRTKLRFSLSVQQLERAFSSGDRYVLRPTQERKAAIQALVIELHRILGPAASLPEDFANGADSLRSVSAAPQPGHGPPPSAVALDDIDVSPYVSDMQRLFDDYRRLDLLATIGIFILGIGVAWFLGVHMTRPVYELAEGFQGVAEGNLETRVSAERRDEFGLLGRKFNQMVERLQEDRELERELTLRERIEHMGDLAAGVAHDVRNPLNAIHLNIGQIRDEFSPAAPRSRERFERFTSDIQREVHRLNQLVTNFLSLAEPSASTSEPVSVNELVAELRRLLHKEAASRQVDLRVDLEAGLPHLPWIRQEMKSAFLNIAMNALQALEPRGGRLDIITGSRAAGAAGREIVITFVDTGCGIETDQLEKVFMPYFTTRKGGTGLGMAIARRITERNGGSIELRSRVGEGTSVTFVFPEQPELEAVA